MALRAMQDQAVLTYSGTDGNGWSSYTNVVSQSAMTTGFSELQSNPFNSGASESTAILIAGGTLSHSETLQIDPEAPAETVDFVELRSPVRVNDRYVHLDKHYADGGFDADGDGKNDALDMAAWTQVVGEETLTLLDGSTVTAVRVDDTVMARVRFSSNGEYSDVVELKGSKWLVAGLGIVKSSVDLPSADNADVRIVSVEQLVSREVVAGVRGGTASGARHSTVEAAVKLVGKTD